MNSLSLSGSRRSYTNAQSWHNIIGEIGGLSLRESANHDRVSCRVAELNRPKAMSVLQDILFDDFQVQLSDDYLTKVDVASMAASLEVRAPFLDVAVVETAWGLPDSLKLRWGQRKWLLKRIASRFVPPKAVYRPKMGFALPLDAWFRADLGRILERLMERSITAEEGWIDPGRVVQALQEHRTRARDNSTRLWIILWLELWFRVVLRKEMSDTADLKDLLD